MFLFFSVIMPFGFFYYLAEFLPEIYGGVRSISFGPGHRPTVMGSFWGFSEAWLMFREQGILRVFTSRPSVPPSDYDGVKNRFKLRADHAHRAGGDSLANCFLLLN